MNGLLIVAHGSRRSESNDEIRSLTAKVANIAADKFSLIECAFLELATPSISAGIESLVGKGAKQIQVMPYFLASGLHVSSDIPAQLDQVRIGHPEIDIQIGDYLGSSDQIPLLLVSLATNSLATNSQAVNAPVNSVDPQYEPGLPADSLSQSSI